MSFVSCVIWFSAFIISMICVIQTSRLHRYKKWLLGTGADRDRLYDQILRLQKDLKDKGDALISANKVIETHAATHKEFADLLDKTSGDRDQYAADAEALLSERDSARALLAERTNLLQGYRGAVEFAIRKFQTRKFADPTGAMLTKTQAWAKLKRMYEKTEEKGGDAGV